MKKFKLKSGNTTSFKNMGSSPAKHTTESKHKNPHSTSKDFDEGGNLVVTDTETGRSATWKKGKTSKGTTKYTGPGGGSQFLSAKSSKKDRPETTWEGTDEYRKPEDIPASEYEERGIKKYPIENPKKSPAKQKTVHHEQAHGSIDGKTYPKGYTKEDVKFLKEQREDVVRYEDLDAKGKAIWDAHRVKKWEKGSKKATQFLNKRADVLKTLKSTKFKKKKSPNTTNK